MLSRCCWWTSSGWRLLVLYRNAQQPCIIYNNLWQNLRKRYALVSSVSPVKTLPGWRWLRQWGSLVELASWREYGTVRKEARVTSQTRSLVKPERGFCRIEGSSWTRASPRDRGSLPSVVGRGNGPWSGPGVLQGIGTGGHSRGPVPRSGCSKHRGGKGPVSCTSTWGGPVGLGFFCLEPWLVGLLVTANSRLNF